jgi:hypothetical protein
MMWSTRGTSTTPIRFWWMQPLTLAWSVVGVSRLIVYRAIDLFSVKLEKGLVFTLLLAATADNIPLI